MSADPIRVSRRTLLTACIRVGEAGQMLNANGGAETPAIDYDALAEALTPIISAIIARQVNQRRYT